MNITLLSDLIHSAQKDWCVLTHAPGKYPGNEEATKREFRHGDLNQNAQARALVRQIVILESMVEMHVGLSTLQESERE